MSQTRIVQPIEGMGEDIVEPKTIVNHGVSVNIYATQSRLHVDKDNKAGFKIGIHIHIYICK